jgi:stage V sporulation protein B
MTEENAKSFEKLAKGSFYLILDNIVNLSLGALFWIVLAKMINAASLGQAMVVIAFATSVIGFAGYGVQVTISKYISEYNARGMPSISRKILKLGIRLALLVSASVAIVIASLSGIISSEAYNDPAMTLLLALAVLTFLPSQTIVSALMGAFQGSHQMKYALVIDSIYQIIRIAIAVILVSAALGSFGIIISFAVASIIASLVGYAYFVPKIFSRPQDDNKSEFGGMRQILKFSGHNYAAVGMKTFTAQIGVLLVGTQNFELAAFYGLAVLISNLVGGILTAVSRAMLPTAAEEWAKGTKRDIHGTLDSGIRLSLLISGFGFLILMVDPDHILRLISEQYIEASDALRVLVVSSIIYSLGAIITSILNAANRASEVAKIGLVSSGLTIGLTFILATRWGIEGAALAMLSGSIAGLIMSLIILKRKENMTVSIKSTVKPAVTISLGLAVAYLIMFLMQNIMMALAGALVVYAVASLSWRITTPKELRLLLAIMRRNRS